MMLRNDALMMAGQLTNDELGEQDRLSRYRAELEGLQDDARAVMAGRDRSELTEKDVAELERISDDVAATRQHIVLLERRGRRGRSWTNPPTDRLDGEDQSDRQRLRPVTDERRLPGCRWFRPAGGLVGRPHVWCVQTGPAVSDLCRVLPGRALRSAEGGPYGDGDGIRDRRRVCGPQPTGL